MQEDKSQAYLELNQNFDEVAFMSRKQTPIKQSGIEDINYVTFEQRGDGSYGRATFIAIFEAGASFPPHVHHYGEEVYVVEGTLTDEFGDYSSGCYIRQAINSAHTPFSKDGCKLFVKMWQMPLDSNQKLVTNTNTADYQQICQGVTQLILYESPIQHVSLYKLHQGVVFHIERPQISELFVIEGTINVLNTELVAQSWMRMPKNKKFDIEACTDCKLYVKIGKGIIRGKNWEQINV